MPLIDCPECGRQISDEAAACPQCGHPNRPAEPEHTGPSCYACARPATTRCQRCGALSCVLHLQSIYVHHGRSGAYEQRCPKCYEHAQMWKVINWIIFAIIAFIILIVMATKFGGRPAGFP